MSRAQQRGSALRRELGLRGQVDAEAAANDFGLTVDRWPFLVLKEMCFDDHVAVAERLTPEWRRWVVAHAVAHRLLHPSNHVWIHRHINLARGFEREAEDFTYGLLVDAGEAASAGLTHSWELAAHFGVPDEMVRGRMLPGGA